jgi:hypothetical protein
MSNRMTRWIEDAEARRFTDTVRFERSRRFAERRHAHLGDAIGKITASFNFTVRSVDAYRWPDRP